MNNISISDRVATIFIYGYIGEDYWGDGSSSTDIDIANSIQTMSGLVDRIDVRLNSYGGDIKHAWAITNALIHTDIEVHTYNDGLIASAAAIIYLAADKDNRHYGQLSAWMYHPIWSVVAGNVHALREEIVVLDKLNKVCAEFVNAQLTTPVDWFDISTDTWLTIDESISAGLVNATIAYEIEDVNQTLFTENNMREQSTLANMVKAGYTNYFKQNKRKMPENTEPVIPAADTTQDELKQSVMEITKRLDAMDTLSTEITELRSQLSQKDQEIVTLKKQAADRPGAEEQKVGHTPIPTADEAADEEDPFVRLAQSGTMISFT